MNFEMRLNICTTKEVTHVKDFVNGGGDGGAQDVL
jgi:hypothetical protein